MLTQDIRIVRLEGKVQTLDDVQTLMLNQLETVLANQEEMKASLDELKANQNELKANQDKLIANQKDLRATQDALIDMVKMIIQDLADIKDKMSD